MSELSLSQKAALGSGADFWTTKAVGSIPALTLTDGPHGVRKQTGATDHLGLAGSEPATCFPPAVGLGQSWDVGLIRRVGEALGREARGLGVDILLGPGVNIKRDPRCGRNFEYFSEDPFVTGRLGAAWIEGVQSIGVGTSPKHFALNNAEDDRMRSSSDVDPRPMREIYLRAFAHIIRSADPWTVMCSYNRINGIPASENHWLLTDLLRGEWGFDGVVVSDWGAVADRVRAVAAGLDLEMPGSGGRTDAQIVDAVEDGRLDAAAVDRSAWAVRKLAERAGAGRAGRVVVDPDLHHRLAREAAGRSIVLLKNEGGVLPLGSGQSVAVIGEFAREPRYQGGGSSHVNPTRLDVPVDEIRAAGHTVTYAPGFSTDDAPVDAAEAIAAAAEADVAVLFLGLAASQESEGFDRDDIELPSDQIELLTRILAVQPRTVVVLAHGGVLRLEAIAAAPAVLDGALLGQAGGGAIADVLVGVVNPSGRLTETVPVRLQDAPAYLNFPNENSHIRYGEGIHVGYRWYDARDLEVAYPFGHGLSYTTFEHSGLSVATEDSDVDGVIVEVTVTNTGPRAGREVVQIYTSKPDSRVGRPPHELAGFAVTRDLEPGESETVSVTIDRNDLAYWDTRVDRWIVETGEYAIQVGASSRDIRLITTVEITGDDVVLPIDENSTLGEVLANPAAAQALAELAENNPLMSAGNDALGVDMARMLASIPLGRLAGFGMRDEDITGIIAAARTD
ncbi:glycoside hydrolase family 3 C-terminal domain-containing protein [Gordonia McavH-238-E]|uniref:glycoside hydrolase family 3 C-terminal domain-containing protein n=1 Tax=Gordonia sp. McavH-238-E TaxID=2917736 RepID=UPI001EF41BC6|nr:glycoside hydrolase family 3 C-terminal domain-containing protein [Gordonia sp. McavH-238-E]MCG7634639.1 glycoside hydrolase family 3 C-terminal domain-containing protein [Gordonia sp. McavH-238-E]